MSRGVDRLQEKVDLIAQKIDQSEYIKNNTHVKTGRSPINNWC